MTVEFSPFVIYNMLLLTRSVLLKPNNNTRSDPLSPAYNPNEISSSDY